MRTLKTLVIISTIITIILLILVIENQKGQVSVTDIDSREIGLFKMTNDERETSLKFDDCLINQARERAKFLFENRNKAGYFAHYTPDGTTPWQFVEKCGYHYAGENLIKGFSTVSEMNDALMKSELHRKNIINPRFRAMGTGCAGEYCVEFFTD